MPRKTKLLPTVPSTLDLSTFSLINADDKFDFDISGFTLDDKTTPLDPLAGIAPSGDVAEDSKRELSALEQAFIDRKKAEQARFTQAVDSEYWVALCFQTREEKEDFLRKLGLLAQGDKYIDGRQAAKKIGIQLDPIEILYKSTFNISPKLAALT